MCNCDNNVQACTAKVIQDYNETVLKDYVDAASALFTYLANICT